MQPDESIQATEDSQERRRLPRMRFDCPMTVRPVGTHADRRAHARSLSGAGLLFDMDEAIALGTRMEVFAQPPLPVTAPLWADVTVVRCESLVGSSDRYLIAAQIDHML